MANPKRSNFKYKEAYSFPDDLERIILKYAHGYTLHIPCGKSGIGDVRVDYDPDVKPTIVWDMWDFPNHPECGKMKFDTVISDPIWNMTYGVRQQFGYLLRDFLKPNGTLIFNAPWILHIKGLKCERVYYREGYVTWANTALISIYRKINESLSEFSEVKE